MIFFAGFDNAPETTLPTIIGRVLNPDQIALLKDYTIGQWSDGIGFNFFQERMRQGLAPQPLVLDESAVQVEQRAH